MYHFQSKNYYLLSILFTFFNSSFVFSNELSNNQEPQTMLRSTTPAHPSSCDCNLCSCKKSNLITKLPCTITLSGAYCLACNLESQSCDGNAAEPSILVESDDVTINLNGFTLTGGSNAIKVDKNINNVRILNGTIRDTTSDAILVSAGCTNISIVDLEVLDSNISRCNAQGTGGITFAGTSGDRISGATISNTTVSGCEGRGISLLFCDKSKVTNANVVSITSNNPAAAAQPIGFYAQGDDNSFKYCLSSEIISTLPEHNAYGFLLENSHNTRIGGSQVSNVNAIGSSNDVAGFFVSSNSQCILIENCISNRNSSQAGLASGFVSQDSTANIFIQCTACDNSSTTTTGSGFVLSGDSFSCVNESTAQNNSQNGFFVINSNNCALGNNEAIGNGAAGFFISDGSNDIFYSNFASGNGSSPANDNFVNIANVHNLGTPFCPPCTFGFCLPCPPGGCAGAGDNINGL